MQQNNLYFESLYTVRTLKEVFLLSFLFRNTYPMIFFTYILMPQMHLGAQKWTPTLLMNLSLAETSLNLVTIFAFS